MMKSLKIIIPLLVGIAVFAACVSVFYICLAIGNDNINFHRWGHDSKSLAAFLFLVSVVAGIFACVGKAVMM